MTIRSDIAIDWGASPRIIKVIAPSTELTVQDLYDTVRSLSADAIDEPEIIDGSGKEILSATEAVGLTVKLLNARVKFEERTEPTDCDIYGGNLVALDANGYPMNPIQYAEYITVTYAKSSSATLVQSLAIDEIKSKTDNLPTDPATQSLVRAIVDVIGVPNSPTIANDLDKIEAKTDNLPSKPADQSLVEAYVTAQVSTAQSLIEAKVAAEMGEVKGANWTDETLKLIKKRIDELQLQPYPSRAKVRL